MRLMEETGMRISECLKLRLSDLNLAELTVYISNTKNKKTRTVYNRPSKRNKKIYRPAATV